MKIVKLILQNYNRLFLNNIERLEFTPTKKINLIIGTNGSGKSSLLKEASPLPFDKKDFTNGYKEVHIEHNNKYYVIKQDNGKFSFKEDGIELNVSGNKKVQLEIIRDRLNYDSDFHKLFLNNKMFTTMSPTDRKSWLIKLSNIDYDYSLAYFRRLLSRDRDIRGTVKVLSNKLLEEQSHLLNNEIKDKYKEDLINLNLFIDMLLTNKSQSRTNNSKNIDIDNILNINEKLLLRISTKYPLSEIDGVINSNSYRIQELAVIIEKDIELLQKLKDVQSRSLDSIDTLLSHRKNKETERKKISTKIPAHVNREEIVNISHQVLEIKEYLVNKLSDISITNIHLTLAEFSKLEKDIMILEEKEKQLISNIDKSVIELNMSIEKKDELVTCNSCSHVFNPYYSIGKENMLKEMIDKNTIELNNTRLLLKDKIETKQKYLEKQDAIRDFYLLYKDKYLIEPTINSIVSRYNIQEDSMIIIRELEQQFIVITNDWLRYVSLKNQMDYIDKEVSFLQNNLNLNNNNISISDLEISIAKNNLELSRLKENNKILLSDKEVKLTIEKFNKTYNIYLKSLDKELTNKLLDLKNEYIDELISYLRDYKFKLEDEIRKSDMISIKVDMLSKDIEDLEKRSNLLRLAIKALCPNEGLIADSILHFMKTLVEDMNYIINSIWSYDMYIQPCELENGELSYNFPVITDGRGYTDDISNTSSSMQEIIDLSFKIVAMKYSKMENYPLFLDEFGKTMDMQHIVKAYQAIDNVTVDTFSQVFIVSHFTGIYNRFSDADTIVMDSENISLEDNREVNLNIKFN